MKPAAGATNGTQQELPLDDTVEDVEEPEQTEDSTQVAQPSKPRKLPLDWSGKICSR